MSLELKTILLRVANNLVRLSEEEMTKAEAADRATDGVKANVQAVKLGERDMHLARSKAYTDAARIVMDESKSL